MNRPTEAELADTFTLKPGPAVPVNPQDPARIHEARPSSPKLPLRPRERYEFIEEHAKGGLGRIWRVRDRELGRELALKESLDQSDEAMARFTREALTTSRLEHPSIVPVHDAGRTAQGELFYTMKLVSGRTLTKVAAGDAALALDARLTFLPRVLAVAEAIAYAHSKGVLHRDLKPDNILVGDFGETAVIDWGLAKLATGVELPRTDGTASPCSIDQQLTQFGDVMGTPAYMSPEQANGSVLDERADVYALGAILYFVVTGRPPFRGPDSGAVLAAVRGGPPPSPRILEPALPADLASIVERAMHRNADRRYPSARALADDLNRYLSRQLVQAHRYSLSARAGRLIQRNKGVAVAAFVALLLLGAGALVAGVRESVLRRDAERSTLRLLEQHGRAELADGRPLKGAVYLSEALAHQPDSLPLRYLLTQAMRPVAAFRGELAGHTKDVVSVAYSPDGKYLVTGSTDETVRLWDVATAKLVRILGPHGGGLDSVKFSPDSQRVVTGALDKKVRVFRADTGENLLTVEDAGGYRVAFTPDGKRLVLGSQSGEVRIRDAATGALLATLKEHNDRVAMFAFSPSGDELYVPSWDKKLSIWNLTTYEKERVIDEFEAELSSVVVSPDGQWVAIAESDAVIQIRERATWKKSHTIRTPDGARWPALNFTHNGNVLLTRTHEGVVRAYHASSGQLLAVVDVRPEGKLFESALSPNGEELAAAGLSGSVTLWSLKGVFDFKILPLGMFRTSVYPSIFLEKKKLIATPGADGMLYVWNRDTGELASKGEVGPTPFALAPSDDEENLFITLFKRPNTIATLFKLSTFEHVADVSHERLVPDIAGSADGTRFASAGYNGHVKTVDAKTGTTLGDFAVDPARISALAWNPNGKEIAASNEYGRLYFLDAQTGKVTRTLEAHTTWIQDIEYSPDGQRIATAGRQDHQVRIWDLATLTRLHNFAQHQNNVMDVSWSRDGKLLATAALDHTAHLYDANNGQLLRSWRGPGYSAQISADGRELLTTGYNGYAVVWNIEPDKRSAEALIAEVAKRSPWRLVNGELDLTNR